MLVFGGNKYDPANDLYAFDPCSQSWSELKPRGTKPSKREGHSATLLSDGRVLLFGGYNGSFLNDVHELTLNESRGSWRQLSVSGEAPAPRDGHSAMLAADGTTLLIFGGFDGTQQRNDLFALDTLRMEWVELSLAGGERPVPRCLHSAQRSADGMVVYGGYAITGGKDAYDEDGEDVWYDDLWELTFANASNAVDGVRWHRIDAEGDAPPALSGHATAIDDYGRVWLHGGFANRSFSNQLTALEPPNLPGSNGSWRWRSVSVRGGPSPRYKHSMVALPGGHLLMFGGNDFAVTRGFFELNSTEVLLPAPGRLRKLVLLVMRLLALVLTAIGALMHQYAMLRYGIALLSLTDGHRLVSFSRGFSNLELPLLHPFQAFDRSRHATSARRVTPKLPHTTK